MKEEICEFEVDFYFFKFFYCWQPNLGNDDNLLEARSGNGCEK